MTSDQHEKLKGRAERKTRRTTLKHHLPAQWCGCRRGLLWWKLQRSPVKQKGETADLFTGELDKICLFCFSLFSYYTLVTKIYNASLISIQFPFGTMLIHSLPSEVHKKAKETKARCVWGKFSKQLKNKCPKYKTPKSLRYEDIKVQILREKLFPPLTKDQEHRGHSTECVIQKCGDKGEILYQGKKSERQSKPFWQS